MSLPACICLIIASSLLAACSPYTEPPEGPYAGVLKRGESVTLAEPDGPFTALSILYRQGGGYLTSTEISSRRLLYRDRVLLDKAETMARWPDIAQPVYFASVVDNTDTVVKLAYEKNGAPVLGKLNTGADYRATRRYPFGFPMAPGLLYFPGQLWPGFLLRAQPQAVVQSMLPDPLAGPYSLHANTLASISPDGAAYALVNSEYAPLVVMVVDAQGSHRDAIGLPVTYLAGLEDSRDETANPYQRLWDWAGKALSWRRNAGGRWEVRPVFADAAPELNNPLEELFLDEQRGYRHCFAPDNAGCLPGWRKAASNEVQQAFSPGYAPPFAYAPVAPAQAFGAPVSLLLFARMGLGGAGYTLQLDGEPGAVAAQLTARLAQRRIAYVRTDQCPRRTDTIDKCKALLVQKFSRPESQARELEQLVSSMEGRPGVLFILSHTAFVVRPGEQGGSLLQTLFRADFSRQD